MGPDAGAVGNLDPVRVMRDGTPESIESALAECHRQAGSRYIVAAGCEVPVGTPEANLRAMARYRTMRVNLLPLGRAHRGRTRRRA